MYFKALKPNDKIALACPGSVCLSAEHPELAKQYMQTHYQLDAVFNRETTQKTTAKERAEILLSYLIDKDIKLIAALRGGEGSADLIPYLHEHQATIKQLRPKPLMGLSDITALLIYFYQHYQWPTIHGPSPLQFALNRVDKRTETLTMDLLFGKPQKFALDTLTPLNAQARETQTIEAYVTGGNLSLLNISISDIWEIDTHDKIIFIEDINEKAHEIIRALKYFSRIGLFDKVKAVILGDFNSDPIGCTEEIQKINYQNILNTLSSFAAHHDFPVFHTAQIGHGKTNLPLLYNAPYRLQAGDQATLSLI